MIRVELGTYALWCTSLDKLINLQQISLHLSYRSSRTSLDIMSGNLMMQCLFRGICVVYQHF